MDILVILMILVIQVFTQDQVGIKVYSGDSGESGDSGDSGESGESGESGDSGETVEFSIKG